MRLWKHHCTHLLLKENLPNHPACIVLIHTKTLFHNYAALSVVVKYLYYFCFCIIVRKIGPLKCVCVHVLTCVCVKLIALQNQFCTCLIFTEGKRRGGRMEAQKGKEEWLPCQSVLYIHAVVLLISAGLLSHWALSSWECVSMCMCKCVTPFSQLLCPWACSEVLLPMPWNTSALSAPPFSLSSSRPQCTPYLDKAAAG